MKTIIKLLSICFILIIAQGCVHTVAETNNGVKFNRWAILYPFKLEAIEFDAGTGNVTILGYDTDGGKETAQAIAEGVANGVIKGMK